MTGGADGNGVDVPRRRTVIFTMVHGSYLAAVHALLLCAGTRWMVAGQRRQDASAQTKEVDAEASAPAPVGQPEGPRAELLYPLTVEELKEMLRRRGLATTGLKADLVGRLLQAGIAGSDAQQIRLWASAAARRPTTTNGR